MSLRFSHLERSGPQQVGFLIPVFHSGGNECFIQIIDQNGNIEGFTRFASATLRTVLDVQAEPFELEVGAPALWVICEPDGAVRWLRTLDLPAYSRQVITDGIFADHALFAAELVCFCDQKRAFPSIIREAFDGLARTSQASAACWRDTMILLPSLRRDLTELARTDSDREGIAAAMVVSSGQTVTALISSGFTTPHLVLHHLADASRIFGLKTIKIASLPVSERPTPERAETEKPDGNWEPIPHVGPYIYIAPTALDDVAFVSLLKNANAKILVGNPLDIGQVVPSNQTLFVLFDAEVDQEIIAQLGDPARIVAIVIKHNFLPPNAAGKSFPTIYIQPHHRLSPSATAPRFAKLVLQITHLLRRYPPEHLHVCLPPVGVFLRTTAKGPNPSQSAWAKLFDVSAPYASTKHGRTLFNFDKTFGAENPKIDPLFYTIGGGLQILDAGYIPNSRLGHAAGIFPYEFQTVSEEEMFSAASNLCRSLGWTIAPGRIFDPTDVLFSIGNKHIKFEVRRPRSAREALIDGQSPDGSMSQPIDSLGLLTSCSPKDVHAALTLTKVLPVTFEDLSNFPGSSKSIWPLIGAQLLRLASKQPSRARTQYYRALIQSAMSSQKQRTGHAEEHVELYARDLNIRCLSASIGDDGIRARFRSTVGRTLGEQNSAREYTLVFQSQHVRISSIHV